MKMVCCNKEAILVDNVPSKAYWYCKTCKNEVLPMTEETQLSSDDIIDSNDNWGNFYFPSPGDGSSTLSYNSPECDCQDNYDDRNHDMFGFSCNRCGNYKLYSR